MSLTPDHGETRVPWGDFVFAFLVIAAAALVWFGTADLPPPRYEPVGSAALPRGLAALMAVLALVVAVRATRERVAPAERGSIAGPLRVIVLGALMIAFVWVMEARIVGFRPAAMVFLFAVAAALGGFGPRRLLGYAVFAVVLPLVLHAIFTHLFYIDLP